MSTTTTTRVGTYQMLWDCPSCGTKKLLGVDHRHCPNCGSPQEENLRYFPSKEDRVPTEFTGSDPDWECTHCGTPTGSNAGFCGGCGAPRGDAANVFVRESIDADASETGEQAAADYKARQAARRGQQMAGAARKSPDLEEFPSAWTRLIGWFKAQPWRLLWPGLGVALVALLLLAVCDREVTLRVTHHTWKRVIPVEVYKTISDSAWCSSTPSDARVSSRSSEIHHYDKVPDGEDCRTVAGSCSNSCSNVDNGNGSFSEVCSQTCSSDRTECTTKYRDVPVYEDKCSYEVDRWIVVRTAEASGADLAPFWPAEPAFSGCPGVQLGCERIGARYGVYEVHYVVDDPDDPEPFACPKPESEWSSTAVGARFIGEVGRLSGNLECEELLPAEQKQ
jgi:hypothetical protein